MVRHAWIAALPRACWRVRRPDGTDFRRIREANRTTGDPRCFRASLAVVPGPMALHRIAARASRPFCRSASAACRCHPDAESVSPSFWQHGPMRRLRSNRPVPQGIRSAIRRRNQARPPEWESGARPSPPVMSWSPCPVVPPPRMARSSREHFRPDRTAGEDHRLAVERPADDAAAQLRRGLGAVAQIGQPSRPRAGVVRGDGALRVHPRSEDEEEARLLRRLACRSKRQLVFRFGNQQFDEVEAELSRFFEIVQVRAAEGPRELHGNDADGVVQVLVLSQPFTAPWVRPEIRRFCTSRNSRVAGSAPVMPPAVKRPHCTSYSPIRVCTATVIVRTLRPPRVSA